MHFGTWWGALAKVSSWCAGWHVVRWQHVVFFVVLHTYILDSKRHCAALLALPHSPLDSYGRWCALHQRQQNTKTQAPLRTAKEPPKTLKHQTATKKPKRP